MSGAAQAREKRDRHGLEKTKPGGWFVPPARTPLYAAIPRPAPLHDDALSGFQSRLYGYLTDPRRATQNEDKSWTLNTAPSYDKIARDLRVSKSTVWRAMKLPDTGMIAKKSVQVYAVFSKQGSKRRVSTHYYMPPFAEVLKERRAIPGIVLTAAGHPIVIGRRCRFVTRELAAVWKIDVAAAPAMRTGKPRRPVSNDSVPVAKIAHPAAPAHGPPPAADFGPIREVLFEFAHRGDESDCQLVFNAAQGGEPEPSIEDVAQIALAGCNERRRLHPEKPQTVKFIRDMVEARVKDWRERARKAARDAQKQGRWARENRLNLLIEALRDLERGVWANNTREAEILQDRIREADAAELIEARAVLARIEARQARKA